MEQVTPEAPSIREVGERVKRDLGALRGAAERERAQILGEVQRLVDQHPFAAVGVAFAAGYVVSGALLSRATARLVRVGVRMYLGRLLRDTFGAPLEQAIGRGAPAPSSSPSGAGF
jgi:hypothetical protein